MSLKSNQSRSHTSYTKRLTLYLPLEGELGRGRVQHESGLTVGLCSCRPERSVVVIVVESLKEENEDLDPFM